MNHNMKDQALPLGIHRTGSRLGELIVADTLVAAGSSALITPAVMIFDRYVRKHTLLCLEKDYH
jgi:hypothetical protein